MKILYILLLLVSIAYPQAVDTIDQVLFLFDDPNNDAIVGIHNVVQVGDSTYEFNKNFTELDDTGTSKLGFWWSPTNEPIRFFDLITWSVSFYTSSMTSNITDTCKVFLLGDFNNDNRVDGFDLNELRQEFGKIGVVDLPEDMDGNGRVDGFDFNEFRKYFGRSWIPSCQ